MGVCFKTSNFNKNQWTIITSFAILQFCNALCVSIQGPFYPHEAKNKGLKATDYGLVFGSFEITVFVMSPLVGAYIQKMGVKRTLVSGIGIVGLSEIFLGLLEMVEEPKCFLGLSFALKVLEAAGNAGFLTGCYSMIAKEFPDNVGSVFSIHETFFGIGMIVGPILGGFLYEARGFHLPFVTFGGMLTTAAVIVALCLPKPSDVPPQQVQENENQSRLKALKIPSVLIALYSVACAAISQGFIHATLEPHMREFELTPVQIGSMFVVQGISYGICLPIFGLICDRQPVKAIISIGAAFIIAAVAIMGPLPILPFGKSIPLLIASLVIHGIGFAAALVSGFADSHQSALMES